MSFDFVDLRLFVAVVERGSITAGARATSLALASASGRLSSLEERLGVALLERGRRGVTPTAAGRAFLEHARLVGGQLDRMNDDLRAFATGLRGSVRLLANTAGLVTLVPRALRVLLAEHPELDVEIEEHTSAQIAVLLARGRGDLGVAADSADLAALETRRLAVDQLVAIVPQGHRLAGAKAVGFGELLGERFVGLSVGALHDHLRAQAARIGRRISFRVRVSSFDNVLALVAAGAGVAVVTEAVLARSAKVPVVELRLTDRWAHRRLVACAKNLGTLRRGPALLLAALSASSA